MALPDKLYKKSERDYRLYDEADNEITQDSYLHWFGPKQYMLIWEGEYLGPEPPAVYDNPDKPTEYVRIWDSKFVEDITADFERMARLPLQTDGPAWYYEKNNPLRTTITGLMGMGSESIPNGMDKALYTSQAGEQTQVGAREGEQARVVTSQVGDKFCRNCGTKLCQGWKFCNECGAAIKG